MHHDTTVVHDDHFDSDSTDVFGFWLYIMSDCVLFGSLFAAFIVLQSDQMYGPILKNYIYLPDVLIETFLLLGSNFTFCLATLDLNHEKLFKVCFWLLLTLLLASGFIYFEVTEFVRLAEQGFRWDTSAQASSFFTLVATHGLHVSFGMLWILIMIISLPFIKNHSIAKRRMTYLGLFWNFLDVVWIFIFTIVYLTGAL